MSIHKENQTNEIKSMQLYVVLRVEVGESQYKEDRIFIVIIIFGSLATAWLKGKLSLFVFFCII